MRSWGDRSRFCASSRTEGTGSDLRTWTSGRFFFVEFVGVSPLTEFYIIYNIENYS
jgi:hypothetical protein